MQILSEKLDTHEYVYLVHLKLKRNMLVICTYLITKQIFQNKALLLNNFV